MWGRDSQSRSREELKEERRTTGRGWGGGKKKNRRLGQIKREVEGAPEVNFVQFYSL